MRNGHHSLARELRRAIRGEVRFDPGTRALYATDSSNYRQPPIGVVIPASREDVLAALEVCRHHGAPIFARGGGTSLAGQCCNAAICFDFSKYMNRVREIDTGRRLARVEPGTILDTLRGTSAPEGLTFGPDPSTHSHCTLGGMIGNNSCGVHSVMAQFAGTGPRTSDNVEWLEIATYSGLTMRVGATSASELERITREPGERGEIYRRLRALLQRYEQDIRTGIPNLPRRVSGYNLTALLPEHGFNIARALVGTESTCVLLLEAMVKLIPNPKARALVVLGYPSIFEAADHVVQVMEQQPIGCEGMDDQLVRDIASIGYETQTMKFLPKGGGWLLVEFGGDSRAEAEEKARALMSVLEKTAAPPTMKLFDDPAEEHTVWRVREAGLGATAHVDRTRPTWEGWEDSSVSPEKLGIYLREFRKLLDKHGLHGDLYGHFGQGCVHTRINFDLESADGVRGYRAFVEDAADLVVSLGGSLSGEHGDGQSRGELLPRMYSPAVMAAFREFKSIWDPDWRMNPGKVLTPYRLDRHLRVREAKLPDLPVHFHYANQEGTFAKATLRCVGVGECRRLDGGTMCPSFMVTREERHSTRGRAHLLFEMLQGDPLKDAWQSEPVKEALDLCLACKGCKRECPVSVDMATYKAEFLSHYYEAHRRPITAYAFGLIAQWARLAARAPRFVNFLTQAPVLGDAMKLAIGMPRERRVPAFAPMTFTQWFARRSAPADHDHDRPPVLLWPDTFNNHFHPHTLVSAVHGLERAGFRVIIPRQPLCCGRPLYDYGMLDTARRWLGDILDALGPQLDHDVPIVGLEPSCVAVFKDELGKLFPSDPRAQKLAAHTHLLGEFLHAQGFAFPALHRRALVHGHCHHKSVMTMAGEEAALKAMGLNYEVLESGCCGMAGSFGFEERHYDVSMKVGERVLLPAVRDAAPDTLIVADGFSCRTQIEQATGRRALHLAEVLDMAIREGPGGPLGAWPERRYAPTYADAQVSPLTGWSLVAIGALAASYGAVRAASALRQAVRQG